MCRRDACVPMSGGHGTPCPYDNNPCSAGAVPIGGAAEPRSQGGGEAAHARRAEKASVQSASHFPFPRGAWERSAMDSASPPNGSARNDVFLYMAGCCHFDRREKLFTLGGSAEKLFTLGGSAEKLFSLGGSAEQSASLGVWRSLFAALHRDDREHAGRTPASARSHAGAWGRS